MTTGLAEPTASSITLDERGILIVRVVASEAHSLAEAQSNVRRLKHLANGSKYPLLVDIRRAKSLEVAARQHYVDESVEYAKSIAIVTGSTLSRVLGNFFIAFIANGKRPVTTRLFEGEASAVQWLTTS